ncbi:MAG: nucleotidyltransferase domain-containing protein [Proteobacteria bacterium]|nr:nucleotidyltransferase domain-containing protein [Pseudomonadota bacterium]
MKQQEIIKKLHSFFSGNKNEPRIDLAYIFGSRAAGKEGPISDYDIAVLFSEPYTPGQRYELAHKLKKKLMTDQVDLVVLNHAPVELRYAVIATGTILYEVSLEVRVEYEALTLSLYGDYLPILRHQRKEIMEESNHEAGVQRYRAALGKTQRLLEQIRALSI